MSDAVMVLRQVRYEQRAFWRNPASAFFAFAFPLMFLAIFGTQNRGDRLQGLGNIPYNSYYVPALITFG
ncbi:MAG: ABC transporter permease, partial [Candidatus Dormibacteria bacterium]